MESDAIEGTASVVSPDSARLSPELIPRDADYRGDTLQVTPINASTDPTPDTPVEAPSEPEVSLRQCGVPDKSPSVRTDADISNVLPVGSRASQPSAPVPQPSTLGSQPNSVMESLARIFEEVSPVKGGIDHPPQNAPPVSILYDLPLPPGYKVPLRVSKGDPRPHLPHSPKKKKKRKPKARKILTIVTDRSAN